MSNKLTKLNPTITSQLRNEMQIMLEQIVWDLSAKYNIHETIVIKKIREDMPALEQYILECIEASHNTWEEN
jgi:hypothetical protein